MFKQIPIKNTENHEHKQPAKIRDKQGHYLKNSYDNTTVTTDSFK
ncbi:hypothetical protein Nizo2806_2602 [Lactiplantibacillus plantarum]|nr:hypothetical protein Nizo2806_2602 [Lactiplantibacillus plantarum]